MRKWRLLWHPDLPGAVQMAIDEALFRLADPETEPALRFYTWREPTLSLGFFQHYKRVVSESFLVHNKIHVVRRITGGRAVLHDREMTYALAGPLQGTFKDQSLKQTYRAIAEALNRGLEKLGIDQPSYSEETGDAVRESRLPQCFVAVSPYEISGPSARKIIGSAQKRTRDRFLQHGSILLDFDAELQNGCILNPDRDISKKVAPLQKLLGREIPLSTLMESFTAAFAEHFDVRIEPSGLTEQEQHLVQTLTRVYESKDWTERGCR
jgi:lipoyl(octanoyl) transferase